MCLKGWSLMIFLASAVPISKAHCLPYNTSFKLLKLIHLLSQITWHNLSALEVKRKLRLIDAYGFFLKGFIAYIQYLSEYGII